MTIRFYQTLLVALIVGLTVGRAWSQSAPKREVRAMWVASVGNIDWPSSPNLTPAQQRDEFVALINTVQSLRMNAVMVQIRPTADALYASSIEPWSNWLTGAQGRAPSPLYDPLVFMVDECHKRGIEFHAWLNPYRITYHTLNTTLAPNNVARQHPEWVRTYGSEYYLDPGEPAVRDYVNRVVMDIVTRYDVDGIHFDDYFYPYAVRDASSNIVPFPDAATFQLYGAGLTLSDWRRQNVNKLVFAVYDSIRAAKPWVKFGIGPFGIWKNIGTVVQGLQSYFDIYADSRGWLQAGKVDYLAPQNYWSLSSYPAHEASEPPYEILAAWWSANRFGRQMLMGNAAYKLGSTSGGKNWPASEIANEIRAGRDLNLSGNLFYPYRDFRANTKSIRDTLKAGVYRTAAFVPTMPWKDAIAPNPPSGLTATAGLLGIMDTLRWSPPAPAADGDTARYYAVYRSLSSTVDVADMGNFVALVPAASRRTVLVANTGRPAGASWHYAVTTLDRGWNESTPTRFPMLDAVRPDAAPTGFRLLPAAPNPFNPTTAIGYQLSAISYVRLEIFDTLGRKLRTLVDETQPAGSYSATFDAAGLPSGVYLVRLTAGSAVDTGRVLLVR